MQECPSVWKNVLSSCTGHGLRHQGTGEQDISPASKWESPSLEIPPWSRVWLLARGPEPWLGQDTKNRAICLAETHFNHRTHHSTNFMWADKWKLPQTQSVTSWQDQHILCLWRCLIGRGAEQLNKPKQDASIWLGGRICWPDHTSYLCVWGALANWEEIL